MDKKGRIAGQLGSEAIRQVRPGGKSGRETKTTFRNAGQIALAMLEEIKARKR